MLLISQTVYALSTLTAPHRVTAYITHSLSLVTACQAEESSHSDLATLLTCSMTRMSA